MSWVLIAIWLPASAARSPRVSTLHVATRAECQAKGERWAKTIVTRGRAWFFCARKGVA